MEENSKNEVHVEEQEETSFLGAIGFTYADAPDEASVRRLLETVVTAPDETRETVCDENGDFYFEWYKHFGEDFGLVVYGKARRKPTTCVYIEDWTIYARRAEDLAVADFFVEAGPDGCLYGICEEEQTGNEVEFRLVNLYDYDESYEDTFPGDPPCITGVRLTALVSSGTIILPVEQSEDALAEREEEEDARRAILERIRQGDENAMEEMNDMMQQMNAVIEARLCEEDYLTVYESYLMPVDERPCIYGVLGEIKEIHETSNRVTGEKLLWLKLDVTGIPLHVLAGEKALVGCPSVGMRLLAKAYMQGTASYKKRKKMRRGRSL